MNERIYLTVAYAEKDQAKALGARWDALARRWFVPEGLAVESFNRWLPTSLPPNRRIPFHSWLQNLRQALWHLQLKGYVYPS